MHRRTALTALASAAAWPLSSTAQAAYPSKTIRIYVPFSAGSGSDTGTRAYGEVLGKLTGQTVVVETRRFQLAEYERARRIAQGAGLQSR